MTAAGWKKRLAAFGALPAHETRNWSLSKFGVLSFDVVTDTPLRLSELSKLLGGIGTMEASLSGGAHCAARHPPFACHGVVRVSVHVGTDAKDNQP